MDRKISLALCIAPLGIVLALFLLTGGIQQNAVLAQIYPIGAVTQVVTPTLMTVSPNAAPNNLDVTLTLTGTGFQAVLSGTEVLTAPAVSLDGFDLPAVGWMSSTSLTATVPWGLNAGAYTMTVANPGGGVASLTNAFTVEQAIGVWTSGGPYGGYVDTVVAHPQISTTVYAIAAGVGLYRSTNGASSWQLVQPPAEPMAAVALKPGTPGTMLAGNWEALYESLDGGSTWQQVFAASVSAIAYAPSAPERVYMVANGTVRMSDDGGHTWHMPGTGLPAAPASSIAVHPFTDTVVLIGTDDGRVFKTDDAGSSWNQLSASLPTEPVRRLLIDPHDPNRVYAMDWHEGSIFHRSTNGGVDWEWMSVAPTDEGVNDLAFHPAISGTLYSVNCWGVYSSTDGGEMWSLVVDTPLDCMLAIALDPIAGLPRYMGGSTRGVLRSPDGGTTWEVASDGMNALQPFDISASESHPEQVYVAASSAGGFASADAGHSWQLAVSGDWTNISAAQADPVQPCVGYLGGMGPGPEPNSGVGCVYRTADCGQTWVPRHLPATYPPIGEIVVTIAVDPADPATLFAGGIRSTIDTRLGLGMVYSTTDGGHNWAEVHVRDALSDVVSIVFDPLVTGTLYLATGTRNNPGGMPYLPTGAVYKSIDGGIIWEPRNNGLSGLPIVAMAIDPSDSNVLYLGVYDNPEYPSWPGDDSGVFKSTDGGWSWSPTNDGLDFHDLTSLFVDPLETQTVYAGTRWHGLYRSTDGGATWTRASGPFGDTNVFCLGGGSIGERTFVYVCTAGGVSEDAITTHEITTRLDQQVLGAGVYQQTIDHRRQTRIYLPLVVRGY
ncbi:MAG: IPT/TIG domain-containing protein [Anaerolineae bacterium]|nr:IPT/TIG domain-containing protein [Anaerolineae bacterium]